MGCGRIRPYLHWELEKINSNLNCHIRRIHALGNRCSLELPALAGRPAHTHTHTHTHTTHTQNTTDAASEIAAAHGRGRSKRHLLRTSCEALCVRPTPAMQCGTCRRQISNCRAAGNQERGFTGTLPLDTGFSGRSLTLRRPPFAGKGHTARLAMLWEVLFPGAFPAPNTLDATRGATRSRAVDGGNVGEENQTVLQAVARPPWLPASKPSHEGSILPLTQHRKECREMYRETVNDDDLTAGGVCPVHHGAVASAARRPWGSQWGGHRQPPTETDADARVLARAYLLRLCVPALRIHSVARLRPLPQAGERTCTLQARPWRSWSSR